MKLVVINDYQHLAREAADWSRLPPGVTMGIHGRVGDADAPVLMAEADIVVTSREETRFDATLLERLPRLRLLVTHGTSNAALDLPALAARGVTVCGTRYGFEMATVELAWGLILGLVKQIVQEDAAIRAGGWGARLGRGLTGRRLGLVGLGRLGAGMAQVGQAMGMEVAAWSENLAAARCEELRVQLVSRHELFATSDVVSC